MTQSSFFQKHPLIANLLLMLLVSVAIIIVIFVLLKTYARQGQEYELPEVAGLNIEELSADDPLELNYEIVDSVYRKGMTGGQILSQNPKAGTKVKKGRKVYITITSYSPEEVPVSNIIDATLRHALSQLASDGLECGKLKFVESPFRNVVLEQSYKGRTLQKGDKVPLGAHIDLTVGLGDEGSTTKVPMVLGKTPSQARRALQAASLNVGREHFGGVKDQQTAVVVQHEPPYTGVSTYAFGTTVELWYKDKEQVNVDKLIKDYKVDSSKITTAEATSNAIEW
ncbi:MAG: PASTA domain-containing protein [Bacteroidales bacterium]|nr:PASTA domain-containing protein [Bacteroidales bacterium]